MAPTAPFGDTPRLRGADQIFVENHAPFYSIFYAHSRLLSVVPVRIDEATLLTLSCHVLSPSLSYPFASFPSLLLYLSFPLLFFRVFSFPHPCFSCPFPLLPLPFAFLFPFPVLPLQTPLTNFQNSFPSLLLYLPLVLYFSGPCAQPLLYSPYP